MHSVDPTTESMIRSVLAYAENRLRLDPVPLVSCASIQGISWLEAAGAIGAENQVLRLIADAAGMPAAAGGCFVSGGSAGNLSALVVAREVAKRKWGWTSAQYTQWADQLLADQVAFIPPSAWVG
jgi:glutamate/tyrosine decarboxylase-like PLP-dependent enzyme